MGTEVQLRLLITAVDRAGRSLSEIADKLRTIGKEGDAANRKTGSAARGAASEVDKLAASLEKAKSQFAGIGEAGAKMAQMGTRIAAAGAAIGATAFFPIKEAATFERSMARVMAVTEETEVSFGSLENKARELGRTTAFTAEEAAGGMRFLGMAGLNTAQVFEAIGPTLDLAAAGELELAEAADIATNVMSAFNKTTADLPHIMDVMAQTAASSNTDVRELAEAISYAGNTANAAGVPFEEVAARVGQLANNGIKGSRAGTNLRGIIASLVKPSSEAETAIRRMGAEIVYTADGSLDLTGTFASLEKAGLSAADAFAIFRRTAGGAGVVFARQSPTYDKLAEKIANADGAASKMRKTMEDNLVGAFTILKSAISGLLIVMGGPMLDSLKGLALAFAAITTKIADFVERFPLLSKIFITFAGGIGALMVVLGALLIPIGLAAQGIAALGTASLITSAYLKLKLIPSLIAGTQAVWGYVAASKVMIGLGMVGVVVGTAFAVWKAVEAYQEWRKIANQVSDSQKQLTKRLSDVRAKAEGFKDIPLGFDLKPLSLVDLDKTRGDLQVARSYWYATVAELKIKAKEAAENLATKSILDPFGYIKASKNLDKVNEELAEAEKRHTAVSNKWKEALALQEERLAVAKEAAEVETIKPPRVLSTAELEARTTAIKASRDLEIFLMEDGAAKFKALRTAEINDFVDSEESKVLTAEDARKRIDLINQKYGKQITEFDTAQAKIRSDQELSYANKLNMVEDIRADRHTALLDKQLKDREISYEEYYTVREQMAQEAAERDIALIEQEIRNAEVGDVATLKIGIEVRQEELDTALQELTDARDAFAESEIKREENLQNKLGELRIQASDSQDFEQEGELKKLALDSKYAMELEALANFGASKEQLLEAQKLLELEKIQEVADIDAKVAEQRRQKWQEGISGFSQDLATIYEEIGAKSKGAFLVSKAISVAEAIMSTYSAAQKAYERGLEIPYAGVYLAPVFAATAVAAGFARVAGIRAQHLAKGGEVLKNNIAMGMSNFGKAVKLAAGGIVPGYSSNSRSDNIPIMATAGEVMIQKPAVDYYGKNVAEAFNRMLIPKDIFSGIAIPKFPKPATQRYAYASGGPIVAGNPHGGIAGGREAAGQLAQQTVQEIKIMNFVDQREMLAAIGSPDGDDAILNSLSRNRDKVVRIIR